MTHQITIDCTCGYSATTDRRLCESHLSAVVECPGKPYGCPKQWMTVKLLKAMDRRERWTALELEEMQ